MKQLTVFATGTHLDPPTSSTTSIGPLWQTTIGAANTSSASRVSNTSRGQGKLVLLKRRQWWKDIPISAHTAKDQALGL